MLRIGPITRSRARNRAMGKDRDVCGSELAMGDIRVDRNPDQSIIAFALDILAFRYNKHVNEKRSLGGDVPHIVVDYSANMEDRADMAGLCDALRLAAIETGILPMPGVRVRAIRADHVSIADGRDIHGYVDISIRLRGGRPNKAKQAATAHIFDAAHQYLAPALAKHSIALSLEMRDIDPDLSPKTGTIRDHLTETD